MKLRLRATECHLTYGITQCYQSPDTSEHTPSTPARQAGTQFTYLARSTPGLGATWMVG